MFETFARRYGRSRGSRALNPSSYVFAKQTRRRRAEAQKEPKRQANKEGRGQGRAQAPPPQKAQPETDQEEKKNADPHPTSPPDRNRQPQNPNNAPPRFSVLVPLPLHPAILAPPIPRVRLPPPPVSPPPPPPPPTPHPPAPPPQPRRPCPARQPPLAQHRAGQHRRAHRRLRRRARAGTARRDLRRDRERRRLQEHEPGHVVDADLRSRRRDDVDRRHRRRAVEPERRLGRHRRSEQPPELVVGRRRLQVDSTAGARGSVGLNDTRHIGRIVIHPANPDVVYVAAVGHLWGSNTERGVFKTTDGGQTWKKVLYVDDNTGATDIVMDPQDPETLFAAMYQRQRKAWGFNGGGPGSGDLSQPRRRRHLDAPSERPAAGRQRAASASTSFTPIPRDLRGRRSRGPRQRRLSQRRSRRHVAGVVHAQPAADVLQPDPRRSEGCESRLPARLEPRLLHLQRRREDVRGRLQHDPLRGSRAVDRPRRHEPPDRRRRRRRVDLVGPRPDVAVPRQPAHRPVLRDQRRHAGPCTICGGLQDNGHWCVPSATRNRNGISNRDGFNIGSGDGFYARLDPTDARTAIIESQDGRANRVNLATLERQAIAPCRSRRARDGASASAGTGTRRS